MTKAVDWNGVVETVNRICDESDKVAPEYRVIVVGTGEVMQDGTKDRCKLYVAANKPFHDIMGEKIKIEKIKK